MLNRLVFIVPLLVAACASQAPALPAGFHAVAKNGETYVCRDSNGRCCTQAQFQNLENANPNIDLSNLSDPRTCDANPPL